MNRLASFAQSMNINRESLNSAVSFIKNAALLNMIGDEHSIGLVSVVPNLYLMGFPCVEPSNSSSVSIDHVSQFLKAKHGGRFMVYNLSEKTYDYSKFDEQVVEFRFPGYPTPPLDKIFLICRSIDAWMRADKAHAAVVHCQTGQGRSVVTLACYLCWTGQFATPMDAVNHISNARNQSEMRLLIPSQRRYLDYVSKIISGQFPGTNPVTLDKIILNSIPDMENGTCRPYIQVFKFDNLIYTSAKAKSIHTYQQDDLTVIFPINLVIDGDILFRVRHWASDGSRVTIFRFIFHTGFVQSQIERFDKSEIDSIFCNRLDDDFLLDLVFSDAIDEEGNPISNSVAPDYWQSMSRRDENSPREKTVPKRFSLFGDDDGVDDDEKDVADRKAPEQVDEEHDLDAYVQGLDNIDVSDNNVDSDTDDLLAELQKEIGSSENPADDGAGAGTAAESTDLDDEINRLLAEANDDEDD